jgi:pimeloyl-ACP methyl ester carboxylesterase
MKWKLATVIILLLVVLPVSAYFLLNPEKNELNETTRHRLGGTYIKLSQGMTHYRLDGPAHGRVVVLGHGATIPIWTWEGLTAELLSSGYRVLSYDMYGRGYSDRPDVTYDQALYTKQLLDLVDTLALEKPFDLIGLSMGGGIAVNFTAHHPARVGRLIVISPLIRDFKVPSFFGIPVLGDFLARIAGIKVIVKRFSSLILDHPNAEKYKALFKEQTTYKGFERSILSMLRNDAVQDYSPSYQIVGKQHRNVLLIWGTEDAEISRDMISSIRSLIPQLRFEPVEGAGHGIVFQQPDTVNRLVCEFLLR